MALSFNQKRVIAGVLLIPLLICSANPWFGLNLFGGCDKKISVVILLIFFIVMRYFGPTIKELEDSRDRKRKEREEYFNSETPM
jgi:hypothetical protein